MAGHRLRAPATMTVADLECALTLGMKAAFTGMPRSVLQACLKGRAEWTAASVALAETTQTPAPSHPRRHPG